MIFSKLITSNFDVGPTVMPLYANWISLLNFTRCMTSLYISLMALLTNDFGENYVLYCMYTFILDAFWWCMLNDKYYMN